MTYGYDPSVPCREGPIASSFHGRITDWDSNVTQYGYDDANRMTSTTLPTGTGIVTSYSYDDADRLTDIEHVKNGSTTLASVAYTLDDVDNRTQRVDQQGTHTYAYDDLYRLTSVTYPGPSTTTYTFDAFGNREEMTTSAGTTTYTYDDADRITQVQPPSPAAAIPYDWDDNGNLVERGSDEFVWDYEDRMVEATVNSVVTTFAYRGDGLRDSRTVGMTTTTFTWDINAGLPVVLDDGSQYVYGAGLSSMKQGGNWYYYLADGLGSTMAIVDASGDVENGYTYDVYGEPTVTGSLGNEFDFAGQQTDPSTGLQYLRARYYDPVSGTFMSREPLLNLPTWHANPIGYALSNPVRFSDPSGLVFVDGGQGGGTGKGGGVSSGGGGFNWKFWKWGRGGKNPSEPPPPIKINGEYPRAIADRIAGGHAYGKHVIKDKHFPDVHSVKQFADKIERILTSPNTRVRDLGGGKKAFWDEASQTIVIYNPKASDWGTAFKPTDGIDYFLTVQ